MLTPSLLCDITASWPGAEAFDPQRLASTLLYDAQQPLLFNTGLFMVLFALFMVIYRLLQPWRTGRMVFTILFSLYFYYKSSGQYCIILLCVAASDWVLGLLMHKARSLTRRRLTAMKAIAALNITANIGMLAYFKYFQLLLDTLGQYIDYHIDPVGVLLPAGISFFTFRSISYIIDIYRGQLDACRNPLDYIFYLTFFPPLLAGPVVRAKDMLPQIAQNPCASRSMTGEGIYLIILGIFKKMVIADFISGNFVDRVFDNPALYSGFENLMATIGFTVQLYCDFSGYSDMAIGIALLLGYRFKENFNAPFKASSPTDFWHRWHISLSTWLRDYVYIPLGGNRCSRPRAWFNQFATMVIGGLWHGASWMYLLWGAAHGLLLVLHKMWRAMVTAVVPATVTAGGGTATVAAAGAGSTQGMQSRLAPLSRLLGMAVTFMLVAGTFMLFRARSLDDAAMMCTQITGDFHLSVAPQFVMSYLSIVVAMAAGYIIHILPSRVNATARSLFTAAPALVQALVLALVLLLAIQVRSSDIVPFVYLQY